VKSDKPLEPHPTCRITTRIWRNGRLSCAGCSTAPPVITIMSTGCCRSGPAVGIGARRWSGRDLRPGMTVLDVAIGTGLVARQALAITGDREAVVGLDVSAGMLDEVRRLLDFR
jgi:demethylmenaquinone methyltransferase/2-methoxy-6-polyprenyl-1,4-benzoquinol methylase